MKILLNCFNNNSEMKSFVNIKEQIDANMELRGFTELTPIQKAMIGKDISERDALVSAQTGSGKTVAFGLSIVSNIPNKNPNNKASKLPSVLIIAPTRELALQVQNELGWLYSKTNISIVSCVGGMDMRTEKRNLRKFPDIILGTPGRLKDYLEREVINLSKVNVVVLDEADEMLNLGFREELEYILSQTPKERRTLLFSATFSKQIEKLASKFQNNALKISTIEKNKQHLDIEYHAIKVTSRNIEYAIMNILRYHEAKKSLVFCGTRANVNHLTSRLNNRGFSVVSISGELSQKERLNALRSIKNGHSKVCVATDVAARGIDLPNLDLVIHADLPKTKESLVHRSGRTGRAGNKGISILMVPQEKSKQFQSFLANSRIIADWKNPPNREDIIKQDDLSIMQELMHLDKPSEEENILVEKILKKYNGKELATALIRKFRENKFTPDDLEPVKDTIKEKNKIIKFRKSVWFELKLGSSQKIEKQHLLYKLTEVGKINKKDIGIIKIESEISFIEINFNVLDKFLSSLENNSKSYPELNLILLKNKPNISIQKNSTNLFNHFKKKRKNKRIRFKHNPK